MAVLTVARELGAICDGEELALCAELGLHCVNKATISSRFKELGIRDSILERFDECSPGFGELFSASAGIYWESLQTVLLKELPQDNVAIIGRGGNFLLKDLVDCFRIRLIAPVDTRIRNICTERDCSEDEARKIIRQSDIAREKFCRYYYGESWRDPLGYDMVINTAEIPLDKLAGILPEFLSSNHSEDRKIQLELAVQEQIIRHTLFLSADIRLCSSAIKCLEDGTVILQGDVMSGDIVSQAEEIVRNIPGVKAVQNDLRVQIVTLFDPMW